MTTTSEAMQVMLVVQGCHPRTASRSDDPDAIRAIAAIWAELFNEYQLSVADLIAGVKKRALTHPDAPEPAEIITFARAIRQARDAETGPTPEYEARCESKAEDRDELAANRQRRLTAPAVERPRIKELVAPLAERKAITDV